MTTTSFNFDVTKTLEAFLAHEKEFNFLNRKAIKYVLEGDFFAKHSRKLTEDILDCVRGYDVIEKNTLSGMLSKRLSYVPVSSEWSLNKCELFRTYVAGTICSVLIDSGIYQLDVHYIRIPRKGKMVSIPSYQLRINDEPLVKDLIHGYTPLPGQLYTNRYGRMKMNAELKGLLRDVGSIPFKVSQVCNKELLLKGYSLMTDYHTESRSEKGTAKRLRIKGYADVIMDELAPMDQFYLPVKLDSRLRLYYHAQLLGLRPQGKLWETLMIDSAEPVYMDQEAINHILHIIYVLRYGRATLEYALEHVTEEDVWWARHQDPMADDLQYVEGSDKELDEFGERILANKCAEAIELFEVGQPCHYLFGKDLTNSGLIMAGASFRSPEMMQMANLIDLDHVHDSHQDSADRLGIDGIERKEVKRFTQGLFHGSSIRALTEVVNGFNPELNMTEDQMREANVRAYGECIENIDDIATWGMFMVDNHRDTLTWTTPDGYKAHHIAKATGVPIQVWSPAAYHKDGLVKFTVTREMPLEWNIKGECIYRSGGTVEVKNRGLYANVTHSLDATLLRSVIRKLLDLGQPFLLKHDDYMVPAAMFSTVTEVGQRFLTAATKSNFYQSAVNDIARNVQGSVEHVPTVRLGNAQTVVESENFLMP